MIDSHLFCDTITHFVDTAITLFLGELMLIHLDDTIGYLLGDTVNEISMPPRVEFYLLYYIVQYL